MAPLLSPPPSLPATPADLWLCLRFEQLSLEALRESGRRPDYVHHQHRLVGISPQAASRGLSIGMSVSQALMVAPDCCGLERNPAREQQQLQALAHWAYRYTPRVSLEVDSLLLEVGHCLKLFKGFRPLFRQLEQDLLAFAVSPAFGVAHTPAAASVLSKALNNGLQAAQDNAVEPEVFLLLLAQAAIETLDIDTAIVRNLQSCGFETLEELLVAPREDIAERFGATLMDYLARLLGDKADPRPEVVPPEPFLLAQDFAEPIHNSQWIEHCTDDMLQQFCEYLRRQQWRCELLEWRFYNDKVLIERQAIPLSSRHYGFETFKQLTDLRVQKLALTGELMRIELFSDQLLPAQLWVEDLFDPQIKQHEAAELVDRLATRLGDEVVYQLSSRAEPVPELAMMRRPFAAQQRPLVQVVGNTDSAPPREAFQPLWLLPEPQLLNGCGDGQPLDHRRQPLQLIQGPDRLDSHWWSEAQIPSAADTAVTCLYRDYYIARQKNGRLLWVFYERRMKQWFLQGLFG